MIDLFPTGFVVTETPEVLAPWQDDTSTDDVIYATSSVYRPILRRVPLPPGFKFEDLAPPRLAGSFSVENENVWPGGRPPYQRRRRVI